MAWLADRVGIGLDRVRRWDRRLCARHHTQGGGE